MSMPVKDEGEFELILGNKQIIAVFVIVLLLMGLFFSIGFLAGRRSASGPETAGKTPADVPITVDATRQQASAAEPPPAQEKAESAAGKAAAEPEPSQPQQQPQQQPQEPKKQAQVPSRLFVDQPPAGTYLQAAATQRADAEAMLSYIISKTGLSGYVAPSPKSPELCRVLIGPLSGNEQIADARSKLSTLGVANAFPVKY